MPRFEVRVILLDQDAHDLVPRSHSFIARLDPHPLSDAEELASTIHSLLLDAGVDCETFRGSQTTRSPSRGPNLLSVFDGALAAADQVGLTREEMGASADRLRGTREDAVMIDDDSGEYDYEDAMNSQLEPGEFSKVFLEELNKAQQRTQKSTQKIPSRYQRKPVI